MEPDDIAAIVTGGASGLGAATARALAAAGARVGVVDLADAAGERIAAEVDGAYAAADVADPVGAARALDTLAAQLGPPRILVNCAGIGTAARIVGREGPLPLDAFERVIRVNLVGSFNMLRLAAAAMQEQDALETGERGVVISTASVAAYEGQLGQAAYAASKGGIVALTLPAARELARSGIRVLAIAPGLFETPLLDGLPETVRRDLGGSIPFPARLGRPEEFADLAVALIRNPYVNGEVVRLDGALRMPPR